MLNQLPPNTYYWRIASVDNFGLPGKFSNHFNFTIQLDTTLPFLEVSLVDELNFSKEKEFSINIHTEKMLN